MNPVDLSDIREQPTYANHLRAFERLKASGALSSGAGRRVAVVTNFTVEPLVQCLVVRAQLEGMPVQAVICPPQEFARTVLESGGILYESDPEIVLVLVSSDALLGEQAQSPELQGAIDPAAIMQALAQFVDVLGALRSRSSATLLVANFVSSAPSPLGILDWQVGVGRQRALDELNHGLADWARQQPRVFLVDLVGMCATAGHDRAFDRRMFLLAQQPFSPAFLPRLAENINRYVMASGRTPRKCLILDLDHTLWGGVLAEEGADGLRLGNDPVGTAFKDFQRLALLLHQRGILLAICSRNDEAEARAVLRDHPEMVLRQEHFAAVRIGWVDKAESIVSIAEELNIGLDAMVFLDDDPFERQNVRDRLPDVLVPDLPKDPVQYREMLLQLTAFDTLQITAEDLSRGRMYQERSNREALKATAKSLDEYLTDLQMEITVVEATGPARQRLFQLVHKTNRFNLTTRRYTEAEFDALVDVNHAHVFGIRVRDRLGDNGIVGVVVLRVTGDLGDIETLLLSCRVLGRSIETAILAYIADRAQASGAAWLQGRYVRSAKNDMVADLYGRHGFVPSGQEGEAELWRAALPSAGLRAPAWARVTREQEQVVS